MAIQVQWVEGDTKKAENSFFKINQQAASLDKTELKLLQARKKPEGIATRAILRSGKGHKYWSSYDNETQETIQKLAYGINEIIFQPSLKNPIKTLDLPIGGKNLSSQAQSLILELVYKTNNIDKKNESYNDIKGKETIVYLKECLRIVRIVNSVHPSSLGLHPAIYFYSKDGRHKPASFWAAIDFTQELLKTNKFNDFTNVRAIFEQFLLTCDYIIQQIVRRYRGAAAGYPHITELYLIVIQFLTEGISIEEIPRQIKENKAFAYITLNDESREEITSKDFWLFPISCWSDSKHFKTLQIHD